MKLLCVLMLLFINQLFSIDYSAFKGTTLVVNFPAHPHYDAAKLLIKDFEKETGIRRN